MYLNWTFHSTLSPSNLVQPGAITSLGWNFPSAAEKLLWSFPARASQAETEAVTSSLQMGVSSQSNGEKKAGASLSAAPFYKASHVLCLLRTARLSIACWTPQDHKQTLKLCPFVDNPFLNSLGRGKRAHLRSGEDTTPSSSMVSVSNERLSPNLLIKLFPLQFLFSCRHSLAQLQVIPVKAQPQMVKKTKSLVISFCTVFPCHLCTLPYCD